MGKYVLKVTNGQSNTAGEKAKKDITSILNKQSYKSIEISLRKSKLIKLITTRFIVNKRLKKFKKNDVFVIQYPMYSRYATKIVLNKCKKKGIKTICVIHDLETLRLYKNDRSKIIDEKSILEQFNCLIVHNDVMRNWLTEQGINVPMVSLKIFDYLNDKELVKVDKNYDLIFAGNLEKSTFLKKWDIGRKITVYGVKPSAKYPKNVIYKGVKTPDELPEYLSGSFGLVWDGDSTKTNNGIFGEYTRYNNPHKVSLYISCGLPVIVWEKAAIASFIKKNKLGLTISRLDELEDVLNTLTEYEYTKIKENTVEMSKKIKQGFFIKEAINLAVNKIS
ncbi:sugar transferase [Pediococcus pentosaceus]|uniref:Beta-1,6-galactofuranosyltransferase n=1 Tax=Pediococcus pentosaceus TaxID=1255 RepID=A0ABQ6XEW2_PEDPE|nr:sugar transferase [Pediococcus pentosaceus]KAF0412436.1 hypothetical protein GBO79_09030 [Pediococcus pentosaceus]KAF0501426.1 hypothetical protein GBP22_08760 [Pediococcus pentosaceus]